MNKIDIEIFKQVKSTKGFTDIYLGYVQFPWEFAIVDYSADRTEGIPLDVFDKVICGLLNIDGAMTVTQIGHILGLNIEDDIENGKYRDLAEYEILTEQIQQLVDFGLVISNGNIFQLTNSGVESLHVGRKFKTTNGYDFTLYYDITGGQHDLAKEAFIDASHTPQQSTVIFNYMDIENIKTFANSQIENMFSPEEGNSFSNLIVNRINEYVNLISVGIIYDFLKNEFRLVFYTPMSDCGIYDKATDNNPDLKMRILDLFMKNQQQKNESKTDFQNYYEENAILTQRSIDYREFLEQDTSLDKQTYLESEMIIVPESFWSALDFYVLPMNPQKIFFNIDLLTVDIIKSIKLLGTKNSDIKIFIAYRDKEDVVNTNESDNIYICQVEIKDDVICSINDKAIYGKCGYVYNFKDKVFSKSVIRRFDSEKDVSDIFDVFLHSWIPQFLSSFRISMETELKAGVFGIDYLLSFDRKLNEFIPYIAQLGLTNDYNETISIRNRKLKEMKKIHSESLKNQIMDITSQVKFDELKNLKEIDNIKGRINNIEKACYEDYTEIIELVKSYKSVLKEREEFIRDILMAKTYIIDTNIFLDFPEIISKIKMPNKVVICAKVTDELDKFKIRNKAGDDVHEKAIKALRNINQALKKEKSKVVLAKANLKLLPSDFSEKSPDNLILCVALMYKDKNPCLLTSDNGLQVKAQICDIPTKNLEEFNEMLEAKKVEKEKGSKMERDFVGASKKNQKNKKNKRK